MQVMPETKDRTPTREEATYQKLLEKFTDGHARYIHGRLDYEQMMASYYNMMEAHNAIPENKDKETDSA